MKKMMSAEEAVRFARECEARAEEMAGALPALEEHQGNVSYTSRYYPTSATYRASTMEAAAGNAARFFAVRAGADAQMVAMRYSDNFTMAMARRAAISAIACAAACAAARGEDESAAATEASRKFGLMD